MNAEKLPGLDFGIEEPPVISAEVLEIIGAVSPAIQKAWELSQPKEKVIEKPQGEEVKEKKEEGAVLEIPENWRNCRVEICDIEPYQLRYLSLGIRTIIKMGHSVVDGGIEVLSLSNKSREAKLKVLATALKGVGIEARFVFKQ